VRVSIRKCSLVATVSGFPQTACAVVVALRYWYRCYRAVYIRGSGWAWPVVSVLIETAWRRLINCRKGILMCRHTDMLVPNEVRRFVKEGTCVFWNESASLKAFRALLHPFISAFLSTFLPCNLSLLTYFRSFNLLSGSSTLRLSFFPFSIIPSKEGIIENFSTLFLPFCHPSFSHSFLSFRLPSHLSFVHPLFRASTLYLPRFSLLPSLLFYSFHPSYVASFLRHFRLISNSIPFLLPFYMEIGEVQTR